MRRGFTLVEVLLVAGIIGVFATLVLPGLTGGSQPPADAVRAMLEADLRRARSEALMRGEPVVAVAEPDGSSWWLGLARSADTEIAGTRRWFGRGGLAPMKGARLVVKGEADAEGPRVFATFDALGSRDEGAPTFELRGADGRAVRAWTLPAGRTRLGE